MAKTKNILLTARELAAAEYTDQASFLQTRFWARQKEAFGWKARYFRVGLTEAGKPVHDSPERAGSQDSVPPVASGASLDVLVLLKVLKAGYTLAYIPHGPGLDAFAGFRTAVSGQAARVFGSTSPGTGDGPLLAALGKALMNALGIRLLALRFDLDWELETPDMVSGSAHSAQEITPVPETSDHGSDAASAPENVPGPDALADPEALRRKIRLKGLIKATADIQPPDTVIVDLRPGEEGILSAMKPKTRYNARLAGKKGVTIRQGNLDDLDVWYGLYEETARRDRIGIHGKDYYYRLLADNPGNCVLLMAEHEGDSLAGIVLMTNQTQATYLYGASSNIKRNLMPAYALQWEGMRLALEGGCTSYDLFGIPPSADPAHPMHGLYQFKTGFGGDLVHRYGTWDLVCAPFAYHAFRIYESLRFWMLRRLKKQFS